MIVALRLCTDRKLSVLVHLWEYFSSMVIINKEFFCKVFIYAGISVVSVIIILSQNQSISFELSKNFAMYSFYMALKYTLCWIIIMFRDLGNIVHVSVSSFFCMIAIYEDTPFFCSFHIYLYNTYYMASSVMDIRCLL